MSGFATSQREVLAVAERRCARLELQCEFPRKRGAAAPKESTTVVLEPVSVGRSGTSSPEEQAARNGACRNGLHAAEPQRTHRAAHTGQ
jgi:hypothetical protein